MEKKKIKKSKHSKKKIKIKNPIKGLTSLIILIFIIVMILKLVFSGEVKEKNNKINIILNNENITEDLKNDIIVENDIVYMSYNDIKKFIDNNIYEENDSIITTSEKKVAKIEYNNNAIDINGSSSKMNAKIKEQNNTIYLPISELENVYDDNINFIKETNIVTIDYLNKSLTKAYTIKNISIKSEPKIFAKTIDKVKKSTWVIYILEINDNWSKIRTQKGIIGYVKTKKLANFVNEREDIEKKDATISNLNSLKKTINDFSKIKDFNSRQKLINEILVETVKKDSKEVIIETSNLSENDLESFYKFIIDCRPILNECGIQLAVKLEDIMDKTKITDISNLVVE